jgi:hypothetical protein
VIVVPPVAINDLTLTSSTVTEPFAPADYNAGTTYARDGFATDPATLIAYVSLQDGNVGKAPSLYPLYWKPIGYKEVAWTSGAYVTGNIIYVAAEHRLYVALQNGTNKPPIANPTYWEDIGPTMKYAMFDTLRNTASYEGSAITVQITPGIRCDTVGLVGLEADTARVWITSGGVTIHDETKDLLTHSYVGDWYEYFTMSFRRQTAALFDNLPAITDMIINVTLSKTVGNVICGGLIVGTAIDLGVTQFNPEIDTANFSTIDRDTYGNSVLIPRRSVPKTTQVTWLPKDRLDDALAAKSLLNAVPALWAGITDDTNKYFQSLVICGIFKRMVFNLAHPNTVILTIDLEEV